MSELRSFGSLLTSLNACYRFAKQTIGATGFKNGLTPLKKSNYFLVKT